MAKVFIFIPAFGGNITAATFESSHRLISAFMQKGVQAHISTFSWPDIEEMRNMALSFWYDAMPDATHLLMIDADMGFEAEMVLDMLTFNEPMVGAIYPKRGMPLDWAGSGIDAPEHRRGFIEVEALGMGCFLIRRDAIDKMVEHFPELIHPTMLLPSMQASGANRTLCFFDQFRTEKGKVAEDISFCRRWRETGGKVWASTAYEISHVGPWPFTACFARDAVRKMEQDQVLLSSIPKVEVPDGEVAA